LAAKIKRRADDAERHEKQLEKDNEDLNNSLADSNAELESALHANRNYSNELTKYKHQSDQLSEQLGSIQKEKRRLAGRIFSLLPETLLVLATYSGYFFCSYSKMIWIR
jgi:hypothetical protein